MIYRRITYTIFIAIFLIAAPLIVLYTMGYRYNLEKGRVQKTGIIRVTSEPKGADIYLNGVKYELGQTPARVEKLLPGDYEIRLAKDGYYDWKKKLPVYENGTTFAEKIILWKKSEAKNLTTTTADSWLVSPDKNIIALSDGKENISLIDINSGIFGEISGGNFETITKITGQDSVKLLSFSPSGRYLLAQAVKTEKISYYLIDTLNKTNRKITGQEYSIIKWDTSADTLYGYNKSGLWNINLSNLKAQLIAKSLLADDFYVSGKIIYFITNAAISRQVIASGEQNDIEKINCNDCFISEIKNNRLFAKNNFGKMFIIDLNRQIRTIEMSAKNYNWLNGNSLIIYNDNEIYIYELAKNTPELITRLGSEILFAIWHPNGRDLIFSTEGKIKIIELDNRELRNIIDITNVPASFMASDRAGNNIYFSVDKLGILKLNIQ